MIYKPSKPDCTSQLFNGWQETIIFSCLQGVMGEVYADSPAEPLSAGAFLGDFAFFAGKPNRELVLYPAEGKEFFIAVPQNKEWAQMIEGCFGKGARKAVRYATKKEGNTFDIEGLSLAAASLPKEFSLRKIDRELFYRCKNTLWCRDFVSQYPDYNSFKQLGLGVVALKECEIVSGASSYSSYLGGIEIEVDTKAEYRRRGLALCCAAMLVTECLKRGLYPSWDAQNKASLALAEKLGYRFDREYIAYEIHKY